MKPIRITLLCRALAAVALLLGSPQHSPANETDDSALAALVEVLHSTDDPQFQLDILNGLSQGLQGRRSVPMPEGWQAVERKLGSSSNQEVRALVQSLSLTFGSSDALTRLRAALADESTDPAARRKALDALASVKDPALPAILQTVLSNPSLRGPALKALAGYDHPGTPNAVLNVYPSLTGAERKDAINTLVSRVPYAQELLIAVEKERVPKQDLTADIIRQIRSLNDEQLQQLLTKVWGVARESTQDKQQLIEQYKRVYRAGGSQPGDASRGRLVYSRLCQQCHQLFGTGGTVGPDLTGSNRSDLDYILQNMVDPNAVIPNDYRTSTIELTDERVITGIIKAENDNALTIITANDLLIVPRNEVQSIQQGQLSMMPEGLLDTLSQQEVRDLIYYLSRPGQVPLPANSEPVN